MKVLLIIQALVLTTAVSGARLAKRQAIPGNINNMDNIQNLLQELEKANVDINKGNNVNKGSDTPVRDALARLFGAFQQMASAYVGVLTSVGKSIGVPIPTIGNNVQFLQAEQQPIPAVPAIPAANNQPIIIKQIAENLQQFQNSAQEVSKAVTNMFTRQAPVDNFVLLNEMSKFVRLWSNQLQDVSEQITRTLGGLESEDDSFRTIQESMAEILKNLQNMLNRTVDNLIKTLDPPKPEVAQNITKTPREESSPSQFDLIRDFKNLLEAIQKRMKALTQQLESAANQSQSVTTETPAEHRDKP